MAIDLLKFAGLFLGVSVAVAMISRLMSTHRIANKRYRDHRSLQQARKVADRVAVWAFDALSDLFEKENSIRMARTAAYLIAVQATVQVWFDREDRDGYVTLNPGWGTYSREMWWVAVLAALGVGVASVHLQRRESRRQSQDFMRGQSTQRDD